MKNTIALDKGTYKILYYRYKAFIIPILTILVCLVVVVKFIIPQINSFFSLNEERKLLSAKIAILKANADFLANLNEDDLDLKLQIVSAALPAEKDFTGILNAVSKTANDSRVSVDDYLLSIGDLSIKSAQVSQAPSIKILLKVNTGLDGTQRFLNELNNSLPISEVSSVQTGGNSSSISTIFYYKPFSPLKVN